MVLEARKSKMEALADLVSCGGLLAMSSHGRRAKRVLWALPPWFNPSQRPPPPNTIPLGVRTSPYEFWEDIFSPCHLPRDNTGRSRGGSWRSVTPRPNRTWQLVNLRLTEGRGVNSSWGFLAQQLRNSVPIRSRRVPVWEDGGVYCSRVRVEHPASHSQQSAHPVFKVRSSTSNCVLFPGHRRLLFWNAWMIGSSLKIYYLHKFHLHFEISNTFIRTELCHPKIHMLNPWSPMWVYLERGLLESIVKWGN